MQQRATQIAVDYLQSTGKFKNAAKVHAYTRTKNDDRKLFWNRGIDLKELQRAAIALQIDLSNGQYRHALYLLKKYPVIKTYPHLLYNVVHGWVLEKVKDDLRDIVFRVILGASDEESKKKALVAAIRRQLPVGAVKDVVRTSRPPFDQFLDTAVGGAQTNAKVQYVRLLLDAGAKPTADVFRNVIYHGGNLQMMKLLLDRGADVRAKDESGVDILYHYLNRVNTVTPEGVELLLKYGARPSASFSHLGRNGLESPKTHLGLTIGTGSTDIVKLILDAGASPNQMVIMLTQPISALEWAMRHHWRNEMDIVKLLLKKGARVTASILQLGAAAGGPIFGLLQDALGRDHRQKMTARLDKRNTANGPNGNKKRQRTL